MIDKLKKTGIVLNGFIHDFATGYWLSAMIVIHLLHRSRLDHPEAARVLAEIERFFFWNTVGAMVIIFATGGMRTFTYVDNIFGEATEETRRRMLVIKHVVLLVLFAAGEWWGWSTAFH